jgi:hypothetical protein
MAQPARPELLQGEAPAGLWDALAAQIESEGYTVERGECDGGANGWTRFADRVVRVRADIDDAAAVKTASHELAHLLLHDGTEYATGCRGRAEVEAESVAYLVCDRAGLASDQYSFVISGVPRPHSGIHLSCFGSCYSLPFEPSHGRFG